MKKYIPTYVSLSLAVICALAFNIIGSEVLADGTLVEPFFLIPIMWMFLFLGVITWGVTFVKVHRGRKQA